MRKIEFESSLRILVKSSIFVFIGAFISKILGYIFRIIIARYYGAEVYGLYSLSLMIVGLIGSVASFGTIEGALRYISFYRGKNKKEYIKYLLKSSSIFLLVSGLFFALLLFFSSDYISVNLFHNPNLTIFLKIFSLLIPISLMSNLFLNVLRAYEKIGWHSFIFNVIQNVSKVSVLIILIFLGFSGFSTAISQFFGTLFVFITSFFIVRKIAREWRKAKDLKLDQKKNIDREIFSYSWPISLSSIIFVIFAWTDSFLIGYFLDATSVGHYNAAVPMALLLLFIPELFMQLFLPLIIKEYSRGKKELISQLSKQLTKWIYIMNLPIFLLMFMFPGVFINLFFGSGYLVAENSLRFLSIGYLISSIAIVFQNLISMTGKSKNILVNTIIASVFNLILNIILIPRYGISGAAFATMLSFILLGGLFFFQSVYYLKVIPIRRKMINLTFIGIVSLVSLIFVRRILDVNIFTLIIMSLIFIFIYLILLFLTKSFDEHDIEMMNTIRRKILNETNLHASGDWKFKNI